MLKQEFVKKAVAVHGDKYDYSMSEYGTNGREFRTTIICKVHGPFEQRPKNHLAGRGCTECTKGKAAENARKESSSTFVARATLIHAGRYNYSAVDYVTATSKVIVGCHKHGEFKITPSNHLNGKGCMSCRLLMTEDEFVEKAKNRHGDKYKYPDLVISGPTDKVLIVCGEHGDFYQGYKAHISGDGCPGCSRTGYDSTKSGTLYVLWLGNLTKIGITNRDVTKRVAQIKQNTGKKFSVLTQFCFADGSLPKRLEVTLLKELRKIYEQPLEKYDGSTEAFFNVDIESLLRRIRELSEEYAV